MHYIRSMLILSQQLSTNLRSNCLLPPSRFSRNISVFGIFIDNTCFSYTSVEQIHFRKLATPLFLCITFVSMLILSQQLSNKFKIKLPPPPSRFQEISLFLVFLLTNTCFSYTSVEQNTFQKISNTTVFMHYIRSMLILSQQLSNKFKIKLPPPPSRFQEIISVFWYFY